MRIEKLIDWIDQQRGADDAALVREVWEALCGARFAMASAPDWMRHQNEYESEFLAVDAAVEKGCSEDKT